jgi:DNA-binding transcriptional ArsR family regulator
VTAAAILSIEGVGDLTAAQTVAAMYLADVGETAVVDLADAVGISESSASIAVKALEERNLARTYRRETSRRGRGPRVAVATGDLAHPDDVDGAADRRRETIHANIVSVLARSHYLRGLSSRTAKQVARELPESSMKTVTELKRLSDDGVVTAYDVSPTRWALVGHEAVEPFRVGATEGSS